MTAEVKSRWASWQPKGRIMEETPGSEPTKPSKPSSVAFVGAYLGHFSIIEGQPWAEWKAVQLNRLFDEQGISGPGRTKSRITAETIRQAEALP